MVCYTGVPFLILLLSMIRHRTGQTGGRNGEIEEDVHGGIKTTWGYLLPSMMCVVVE